MADNTDRIVDLRAGGDAMGGRSEDRGLAERLRRVEDIESISRLKAAYCAACDDDHNADAVVRLFAPGGTWVTSLGTECSGLDALRAHFESIRASGRMRYSTHMVTNPVIDVTNDRAFATWSFTMMYAGQQGQRFRILGFYRDRFVLLDGEWRFIEISSIVQDYVQLTVVNDLLT